MTTAPYSERVLELFRALPGSGALSAGAGRLAVGEAGSPERGAWVRFEARVTPQTWSTTRIFATDRAVFVGTPSGEVSAYCLADGSAAWSQNVTSARIRSIGGSDEILYVGTPQGALYAIRPPQSCR
jgi:outer membrane protein assembly factor BamB